MVQFYYSWTTEVWYIWNVTQNWLIHEFNSVVNVGSPPPAEGCGEFNSVWTLIAEAERGCGIIKSSQSELQTLARLGLLLMSCNNLWLASHLYLVTDILLYISLSILQKFANKEIYFNRNTKKVVKKVVLAVCNILSHENKINGIFILSHMRLWVWSRRSVFVLILTNVIVKIYQLHKLVFPIGNKNISQCLHLTPCPWVSEILVLISFWLRQQP